MWPRSHAWRARRPGRRREQGLWRVDLLPAALRHVPGAEGLPRDVAACRRADPEAVVFLVEYATASARRPTVARRLVAEFAFAARSRGRREPVGTWCELNKPQRDHFSFLCNHIEVMFRTGRPSYPVERTYLVTGVLAALMDSRAEGGRRVSDTAPPRHPLRPGPGVDGSLNYRPEPP